MTKAGKPIVQAKIVGRVVGLQGEIGANAAGEAVHKLILDSPVYEGDILQSGSKSYAIVIFRDGGRITLQADSQFKIEQYKYGKDVEQESAILRLLKGGARVITGLIGRINHDNYSFRVAAATLGIRGTGCGEVRIDLDLSTRTYSCGACGLVIDRDVNAAINLARWRPKEPSAVTLLAPTRVPLLSTA
ncbi:MAG: transposase [Acidobacteria bacterium]|nr:transposase [Acidobacteriota bacterium]